MRDRFEKPHQENDEVSLQITSMADIFTIILVFLLKSYSSMNITPSPGVTIPQGIGGSPQVEALKLEVSQDAVLVENKPITSLQDYHFSKQDLLENRSSRTVVQSLTGERKRQELIAQSNPTVKVDSKILIIADQKTPYSTLKTVLASAALTGYTDYKLVVITK